MTIRIAIIGASAGLLHGARAVLALPGRTCDMLGPGWWQQHGRMSPGAIGVGQWQIGSP
jgi:hypothetical protein